MQTFLPYPDFAESAGCLDRQRLGKQRIEAKTLLKAIMRVDLIRALKPDHGKVGWEHHPAFRMWRPYPVALAMYMKAVIDEWVFRGYKNAAQKVEVVGKDVLVTLHEGWKPLTFSIDHLVMPPWIGNEAFHASHRSNLLRKNPLRYGLLGWREPPTLPYVWPDPR